MKKLLAVLMAAALCLTATACAKNQKDTASKSGSKTASSSDVSSAVSSAVSSGTSSIVASSTATSTPASPASSTPAQQIVNVTITPGMSVSDVASKLESAGICSKSDFYSAVNSYPFTEACMGQIQYDPNTVCFRLEGYLYPDTYTFYTNMKAQDAIGKMLRNADNKIVGKYSFQTVIIASIIEKEAPDLETMKYASAVFHNRLDPKNNLPYLQSEATRDYCKLDLNAANSAYVDKYKTYYNTNPVDGQPRRKGLPTGPICNPGANALDAAANPANKDYLYFASDKNTNKYYFNHSLDQLNSNMKAGVNPTP